MNAKASYLRRVSVRASLVAVLALLLVGPAAGRTSTAAVGIESGPSHGRYVTTTVDRFVSHVSTVPANAGEAVQLFVREVRLTKPDPQPDHGQDEDHATREKHQFMRHVVVMAGGGTQPAMASFNLEYGDYNWMEYLANAGFDVFSLDFTGYGLSPRPRMDDPCNTVASEQRLLLIPNPLAALCTPKYQFKLTSRESDDAELDSVVDFIRNLRDVATVDLVGWSRGGSRIARYAASHPEKVGRLVLYAPGYNRAEATLRTTPEPGIPMTVRTVSSFFAGWNAQAKCADEIDPGIRAPLAALIMSFDPLGQTWGSEPLWRAPNQSLTGWNQPVAAQVKAPTLIIGGELDTTVLPAERRSLYDDLTMSDKVLVSVACAAHQLVWERQHTVLDSASLEWLTEGTFAGQTAGVFRVDTDGVATPAP